VHLQEIVLPAAGGQEAAVDLVKRARGGEDFTELARQYSRGPTKDAGGDLGKVSRGDIAPDIEKVAFALAAGGISDPLPAANGGYRILRVVEKTDGRTVPFAEVKDEIVRRMGIARIGQQREAYLAGLRKTAMIDLRVREVPLQVTVPATSLLEPPSEDEEPAPAGPGEAAPAPSATGTPAGTPATPAAGAAGENDDEFSTTPQARPERIAPPPPGAVTPPPASTDPAAPAPAPRPTPTPTPPPR
jgi:hypothetical protein